MEGGIYVCTTNKRSMRFLSLFLACFIFFGCNRKTAVTPSTPIDVVEEAVVADTPSPSETRTIIEKEVEKAPELILSFRKTSCYGKCPSYEVRFFDNGLVVYHGKRNVKEIGYFKIEDGEIIFEKILAEAKAIRFFDLADAYPMKGTDIPDLPNTFTYIKDQEQEKRIKNNHDAPQTLIQLEQFIQDQLAKINWQIDPEKEVWKN